MGLELPSGLVPVLAVLGFRWPESDETALFDMADRWIRYADTIEARTSEATAGAQAVWRDNAGEVATAFRQSWTGSDASVANLATGAQGARLIGVGLLIAGGIVLSLKISIIAQLVLLVILIFQAVATAIPTFGLSLLEIPVFRAATRTVLDQLRDLAIRALLDE